ncbi:MAG: heavy-metal-associated domain-containing protein [Bacteroidales bacterium]
MKKMIKIMTVAAFVFATMGFANVEAKEGKIKVNGSCGMCKTKIEKAAKSVSGVQSAVWNTETKELTLNYDEKLTDIKTISQAVAKIGYDAGEIKADKEARAKLSACCKGEGGNHHGKDKACNGKEHGKNGANKGCKK